MARLDWPLTPLLLRMFNTPEDVAALRGLLVWQMDAPRMREGPSLPCSPPCQTAVHRIGP